MKKHLLVWSLAAVCFLASCKKDTADPSNPVNTNDPELITTITLTYTNVANPNDKTTGTIKATQGLRGTGLPTTMIMLSANKVYNVEVKLLNEADANKVIDITKEVQEEAHEHQFFYEPSAGLNLTVAYKDKDKNNLNVGILTEQRTGAAGLGKLRIRLKHQPAAKSATSTVATGDTDVDVNFDIHIM